MWGMTMQQWDGDGDNTDATTKLFPVRLIAVHTSVSTFGDDINYYEWEEMDFDPVTGAFLTLESGRTGTYSPTDDLWTCPLVELNNTLLSIPTPPEYTYVWIKLRGMVLGDLFYEFQWGAGGACLPAPTQTPDPSEFVWAVNGGADLAPDTVYVSTNGNVGPLQWLVDFTPDGAQAGLPSGVYQYYIPMMAANGGGDPTPGSALWFWCWCNNAVVPDTNNPGDLSNILGLYQFGAVMLGSANDYYQGATLVNVNFVAQAGLTQVGMACVGTVIGDYTWTEVSVDLSTIFGFATGQLQYLGPYCGGEMSTEEARERFATRAGSIDNLDEKFRALINRGSKRTSLLVIKPPCKFEGIVLPKSGTSSPGSWSADETRAERSCSHPQPELVFRGKRAGVCVRGQPSTKLVVSCAKCSYYERS